jgi:hypothetical protein
MATVRAKIRTRCRAFHRAFSHFASSVRSVAWILAMQGGGIISSMLKLAGLLLTSYALLFGGIHLWWRPHFGHKKPDQT